MSTTATTTTNANGETNAGRTVAITGLNGFIATHVGLYYLNKGWNVKGSFRSPSSASKLNENPTWTKWLENGRLKAVIVPDLNGDLTELLEGVEAVAHLAAPIEMHNTWEAFKVPAIEGTLNLLNQVNATKDIKAVSIMSSFAAVGDMLTMSQAQGVVYTEKDWCPYEEDWIKSLDPETNPFATVLYYAASKKFLEIAVNDWVAEKKPEFAVSFINPPMVYGPLLQVSSIAQLSTLNGSVPDFINLIKGRDQPLPTDFARIMVDARDVAQGFYNAIEKKKEGRFFVAGHHYTFQQYVEIFRKLRPDLSEYFPLGDPNATQDVKEGKPTGFTFDNSKSVNDLGVEFTPLEKTLSDALDHFEALGIFKIPPGAWVQK